MTEKKIINLLKKNPSGLSIAELVRQSKLSRFTVRTILSQLEGAKKVSIKQIGMAKVYILNSDKNK